MHDIRFIRENPAAFDAGLKKRNLAPLSAELLEIDKRRRAAISESEAAQAQRKALSRQIGIAKGKGEPADALMAEVASLEETLKKGEAEAARLDEELTHRLEVLPNLPFDDVPDGTDETGNVEIRRVGSQRNFSFPPKDHVALGEATGEMDFASAAKISGARFVFLKKHLARLERAIAQFMLDLHTSEEGGYTEVNPPLLVRDNAAYGVGQLPKFAEDMFHTDNGFWLVPTAEVPLTNLVNDTIVEEKDLPLRFTAFTPCFRSEAGAAGKDTRGMIRQHQFPKVELVSITTPEQSDAEHQRMTGRAEEVLKRLGLPFRTIVLCGGDMGPARAQDLRHRSLAARPERLSRDFELLELRRVPGAPHGRALSARRKGKGHALRAHAERLGPGGRPHADRGPGELPERGRLGDHPRGAAALHGRA